MNIGIVVSEDKRLQIENFCYAYKNKLNKHNIFTIDGMGDRIEKILEKPISVYLPADLGGINQFITKLREGGLDVVFILRSNSVEDENYLKLMEIEKECDEYTIPLATNIATAEVLIMAINNGEFCW